MVKLVGTHEKVLSQKTHVNYQSSSSYCSKVISKVQKYVNVKVTESKKSGTPGYGLATRNTHVRYQSSSFHCSNIIRKVKVSDSFKEWQNDRQNKNNTPPPHHRSQGIKLWKVCSLIQEASGKHCSPELQFLVINKFKQNAGIPVLCFNSPQYIRFYIIIFPLEVAWPFILKTWISFAPYIWCQVWLQLVPRL